jgi:exopolysaccharide production protein ExoZ
MRVDPKKTFTLVQVLRGVAALMVVGDHVAISASSRGWMPPWTTGGAGVDIFFVISGFVMALSSRSLEDSPTPGWSFLKRRLERILPLYWILTTVKLALMFLFPATRTHDMPDWHRVLFSFLLLPTRNADLSMVPIVSWAWTLQFEMLFYLLFTVALALRWKPVAVVAPVLGAMAMAPLLAPIENPWLHEYCKPIVLEFLFGMLVFWAYERGWRLRAWAAGSLLVAAYAELLLTPDVWQSFWRGLEWGAAATAVVAAAALFEDSRQPRTPRWMLRLGDSSYSLYLSHTPVCVAAVALTARLQLPVWVLLGIAWTTSLGGSVLGGELLFRWVEYPMIRFFRGRRRVAVESGT